MLRSQSMGKVNPSCIPSQAEIDNVNKQVRKTRYARLVAFADVVSRYTQIVLRNKESQLSWLRTSALLFTVTRGGSLTPSQLARIMLRSNYSITKLVDGLETDGLLVRCRSSKDGRSFDIRVTEAGLSYVTASLKNSEVAENELKSCLDEQELETLAAIIRKLRDKLIEKASAKYRLSAEDKKAIFGKADYNPPD